jgi:Zn-dependent peptidase ImmA (M78 family)
MKVEIKKDIILWTLSRAGYKEEDADLVSSQIKLWLSGQKQPTIKQLVDFSRRVNLPFGYLFLDKPLEEKIPIPYFRTEGGGEMTLNMLDAIKLLQNRQEWLRTYLEENEYKPLDFVGKFKDSNDYKIIIEDIKKALRLRDDWASEFKTWWETLEYLSKRIEEIGIVIVFNSVVGNNPHRKIEVEECRGFILVDNYAPFMFVNNADAKSAQLFTIVHELAHIWIGLSAGFDLRRMLPADDPKEKFCDKIAAEFLVPENFFNNLWNKSNDFENLSTFFKVSPIVIARRALDLEKISKHDFFDFYKQYKKQEYTKRKGAEGGNFYHIQKKRLGLRFSKVVHQAVREGKLLYRDAYHLTGLSGETYQNFVNRYLL